ncbi:hypothetical protein JCM8547_009198 [Rhodosporidiobolus lusitaniae]
MLVRRLRSRPIHLLPLARSSSSTPSSSSPSSSRYSPDPRWPNYRPTIGLELHVQLAGSPKLFSPARAVYDAEPNKHVARFDAALPGSLPVLQPLPVHLALLASLALSCRINRRSTFDRKHYFYPDLPSGFQVTQKYAPLAKDGSVRVPLDLPKKKKKKRRGEGHEAAEADEAPVKEFVDVRIEQVQLEQDTAKSFHDPLSSPFPPSSPDEPSGATLIDLNRAGAALIEIVTHPDMSTPEEAGSFVKTLQSVLRHVGASRAGMEKGELRCDVNVSVAPLSSDSRGTRCEIKNLNGVRFVQGAIEAEITRQIKALENGEPITQATRGYDAVRNLTFHLRGKEDAVDYRYMPDPELGEVRVTAAQLEKLRKTLPELPSSALARLQSQYGLSKRDAGVLVALGEGAFDAIASGEGEEMGEGEGGAGGGGEAAIGVRWFEEVVEAEGEGRGKRAREGANWLIHSLLGLLSKSSLTLASCPVTPEELAGLIDAVKGGRITGTNAKQVLRDYLQLFSRSSPSSSSASPSPSPSLPSFSSFLSPHLSSPHSPSPSSPSSPSSSSDLSTLIAQVIAALPEEAEKVRRGNRKVIMRMVGEAMKRSGGRADAKGVREGLERALLGKGGEE